MKKITLILSIFIFFKGYTQDVYLSNDENQRNLIDRYQILYGSDSIHFESTDAYYSRQRVAEFSHQVSQLPNLSKVDAFNLAYLKRDNHDFLPDSLNPVEDKFLKRY